MAEERPNVVDGMVNLTARLAFADAAEGVLREWVEDQHTDQIPGWHGWTYVRPQDTKPALADKTRALLATLGKGE